MADAPTSAVVRPWAEAYAAGSGPVGVLFCHGFTGSPHSMLPWARVVEAAGFRVSVPRLPGHGTTWQEMNTTSWTDWYATVEAAFAELSAACEQVFVFGLSMGGALALRLAEQHGSAVAGLVLVNPAINLEDPRLKALPVLRLLPSLAGISNDIARPGVDEGAYDRTPLRALYSQTRLWADVRANLARVDQPLLVYRSDQDHVVDATSLALLRAGVSSTDTSYVALVRSYHVATLDYEAADIFDGSVALLRRLAVTGTASGD